MGKMDKWISGRRHPLVMRFTQETAEGLMHAEGGTNSLPLLFLVAQDKPELEDILREAARDLRGRAQVVLSGVKHTVERRLMDLAGIDEDSTPILTLLVLHGSGGGGFQTVRRYRLETKDHLKSLKSQD